MLIKERKVGNKIVYLDQGINGKGDPVWTTSVDTVEHDGTLRYCKGSSNRFNSLAEAEHWIKWAY